MWSNNFVADRLSDGSEIRMLTVIDEYSRRHLANRAAHCLKPYDVLDVLSDLLITEGLPD